MNDSIRKLEPRSLWGHFVDLNAVPRPSKKEERVIAFMLDFANRIGLESYKDSVGNVIIRKPATAGYEHLKPVVLQAHLDMVHQKNNDTNFDFSTQGIEMEEQDGWVKAKGTTLGADNGIGVAAIMAILESQQVEHPSIEALFTIDEEMGMSGAKKLEGGILKGEILLNLDTEEDDELDIGCAGGVDVSAQRSYHQEDLTDTNVLAFEIVVKGLQGGHSGMDIHLGRGNANKIMNRLLFDGFENFGLRISSINGGGLRNAIPRESRATVVIESFHKDAFLTEIKQTEQIIREELSFVEPDFAVEVHAVNIPDKVMDLGVQEGFLRSLYAAPNGVYSMSKDIPNLVETSNNIARVTVENGSIQVYCLTRSSVESSKMDLANVIRSAFELSGFDVYLEGSYPGWKPSVNSPILQVVKQQYKQLFSQEPKVVSCHAGLECGILGQNYPQMDMISFGPTIKGAHSPDEKVNIASVQKFWRFLLEILKNIPAK